MRIEVIVSGLTTEQRGWTESHRQEIGRMLTPEGQPDVCVVLDGPGCDTVHGHMSLRGLASLVDRIQRIGSEAPDDRACHHGCSVHKVHPPLLGDSVELVVYTDGCWSIGSTTVGSDE